MFSNIQNNFVKHFNKMNNFQKYTGENSTFLTFAKIIQNVYSEFVCDNNLFDRWFKTEMNHEFGYDLVEW